MQRDVKIIGQSSAILDAFEQASRAASLDRPVLVVGERGTGKELVAERLHRLSPRWGGPLITMNCAALPETLIEAELFGHEAGAFTGATKARAGRFEMSDGGTLFLDELGTLSMAAQERLLRAVEYGEITRIGASQPVQVDVRLVAATNEDLPAMVDAGKFRADLLDRLSFEVITLPPLRHREGDVALLIAHFGGRMAIELNWQSWPGFAHEAQAMLEAHDWPGNVRELRNVIERAVYRWAEEMGPVARVQLDPFESPWRPRGGVGGKKQTVMNLTERPHSTDLTDWPPSADAGDIRAAVQEFERQILTAKLEQNRFNQRTTARDLGLSYDQLRHMMKRHKLSS
jgi:psp operon transcriptional activator